MTHCTHCGRTLPEDRYTTCSQACTTAQANATLARLNGGTDR